MRYPLGTPVANRDGHRGTITRSDSWRVQVAWTNAAGGQWEGLYRAHDFARLVTARHILILEGTGGVL